MTSLPRLLAASFMALLVCGNAACNPSSSASGVATSGETLRSESNTSEPTTYAPGLTGVPLTDGSEHAAVKGAAMFEELKTGRTGIDFVHDWIPPDEHTIDLETMLSGAGAAVADYDGDELPDIFLSRMRGGHRLFRNLGDFRFEDVTADAGIIVDEAWGQGAAFVDIDNDGDLDLFACVHNGPNRLYINNGQGAFTEQSETFGLDFSGASVMPAFADFDRDGDLDLYIVTNKRGTSREWEVDARLRYEDFPLTAKRPFPVPPELRDQVTVLQGGTDYWFTTTAGQTDLLYRNEGNGTFRDISQEMGFADQYHLGLSATWWDYNNDGWPDLYVANDFYGPDHLYRNNGNDASPQFTDVSRTALPHTPWSSMGADSADINNDGRFDFIGTDMASIGHFKEKVNMGPMSRSQQWFLNHAEPRQYMRNAVYLNTGTERFLEAAFLTGLDSTDWTWSVNFVDFDNDSLVDLFVSNGMTREWTNTDVSQAARKLGDQMDPEYRSLWLEQEPRKDANLVYRNLGDLEFAEVGPDWGLDRESVSYGATPADLDGDGDMDLVVVNFQEQVSVYRNGLGASNRVKIRLVGTSSNRQALGATVFAQVGDEVLSQYVTLSRGFMSAGESIVHFGLGDRQTIDVLTVRWPNGGEQRFEKLPANQFYTVTEPAELDRGPISKPPSPTMFVQSDRMAGIAHKEKPYDDFARQPLLPNKLSQLGGATAWGDVDNDGDEDMYVGGASGEFGQIVLNPGDANAKWDPTSAIWYPFHLDAASEDMGALFFDVDSDGDQDLYVVSGGVECEPGDDVLRDRLYLNQGDLTFVRDEEYLPDFRDSGGPVSAADFDQDGDLDLFVGGRVIPGKYPQTPTSRLLENQDGKLVDITASAAPGLAETGMVTSALWSDADGDGDVDLLLAHEWGPIKLWRNEGGQLTDETESSQLGHRQGWFNSIAGRDVDNDGDIDYVVTNFGLNTKYHPSAQKPVVMYYGQVDESGESRILEAKYGSDGELYPVRGRACSMRAIPIVKERFGTYKDFALASLSQIYTPDCLDEAERFEANSLESAILLNDGTGQFEFVDLPRLAQISPGFGVCLTEVDGDGLTDLYMVQNFFGPQAETGRFDGGMSQLLLGQGDGQFALMGADKSGLIVPGDAKGLVTTDLNDDGWPDFVVSINDGELMVFEHQGGNGNRILNVQLRGRQGNRAAAGARVTVTLDDGTTQTAEVASGGGYLSQSPNRLAFGLGAERNVASIAVQWPDGSATKHSPQPDEQLIVIEQ